MKKTILLTLAAWCAATGILRADYAAGGTAGDFLRVRLDARSVAMGGAGVALLHGPAALQVNPAGLAAGPDGSEQYRLALNHVEYPAHIRLSNASFAKGSMGTDLTMLYVVDNRRDAAGNEIGTFLNHNTALAAGYAFRHDFGLMVGVAARYLYLEYDGQGSSGVTFDAGAMYQIGPLTAGTSVRNLGWGMHVDGWFAQMPVELVTGVCARIGAASLVAQADLPANGRKSLGIGTEYSLGFAALRVGYIYRESGNELRGADGLTAGVGIAWRRFSLDYAYVPFGDFATVHRFTLGIGF